MKSALRQLIDVRDRGKITEQISPLKSYPILHDHPNAWNLVTFQSILFSICYSVLLNSIFARHSLLLCYLYRNFLLSSFSPYFLSFADVDALSQGTQMISPRGFVVERPNKNIIML